MARKNHTTENQTAAAEDYSKSVCEFLQARFSEFSAPLAFVHTFGCQQNVSDGEKIKGMLLKMGYGLTDDIQQASLILYNTCAVREHAQLRVFGNIGALKGLKKRNRDLIIAICGCMVQQTQVTEKIKKSYPYVDIVFGTHVIHRLPEFVYSTLTSRERVFELTMGDSEIKEDVPVHRDGKFKAWLPVMYGCDNYCSYCIVPYVRGRERSRRPDEIMKEAKALVAEGYKDITLLGQNVNSYGKGEAHGVDFAKLLAMLNSIEGDFRIRFMTSHPKDCSRELLDIMAECEKVSKHLHLPVQSGSDRILKLMNRRYTQAEYLHLTGYAKSKMQDISLTSDIIVGFPGETYEDFLETLEVIRTVGFSSLFTFIYSKRPGTPAAEMEDRVSRDEKNKWFSELLKLQEKCSAEKNRSMIGKTFKVLVEDVGRSSEKALSGRTDGNILMEFEGDKSLIGKFVDVKAISALTWIVKGEMVNNKTK